MSALRTLTNWMICSDQRLEAATPAPSSRFVSRVLTEDVRDQTQSFGVINGFEQGSYRRGTHLLKLRLRGTSLDDVHADNHL
jgi:hypothetical protein